MFSCYGIYKILVHLHFLTSTINKKEATSKYSEVASSITRIYVS